MLRKIAWAAVALLVSCGPTIKQAALEPPARVNAVAIDRLTAEQIDPGEGRQWFTDAWQYTSLAGKPEPAIRLHIPALDRPHYLVLKTYAVSPATHVHFGTYRYWPLEQPWMAPVALYRQEGSNLAPVLSFDAFRLNSNMRMTHVLGIPVPAGETWKQAAIRLEPGSAREMLLVVDAASVGRIEALPGNFWPFRGSSFALPVFIAGMPIIIPIPNPPRSRVEMFLGRVGLVQVDLVRPKRLLATSAGSKYGRDWLKQAGSGEARKAIAVQVRLPDDGSFGLEEQRSGPYLQWRFFRSMEDGSELRLHVVDALAPQVEIPDELYQALIDDLARHVEDMTEKHAQVMVQGRECMRFEAEGRVRQAYMLPWRGLDMVCMIHDPKQKGMPRLIRVGGSFISAPGHEPRPGDLSEVEQFVRSLRFIRKSDNDE